MIDVLVPPTAERGARRVGTILIVLGVFVWFLFPLGVELGTATEDDRRLTAIAAIAAGLLVRMLLSGPFGATLLLAVHAGVQFAFGGPWLGTLSAIGIAYVWLSRARGTEATYKDTHEHPPHGEGVREIVESVAMALVLALTVREFAYEAFQIPTGSMRPTIYGKQADEPGDRLLASKWSVMSGDPPRWSIVVFHYPLYRSVNYIKRLIGLPGERVEIRAGDIYVNGEVMPKPDLVQESLWSPEFPGPIAGDDERLSSAFVRWGEGPEWEIGDTTMSADVPAGATGTTAYTDSIREADVRVQVSVDDFKSNADDAAVVLAVQGGYRRVTLTIGPDGARLTSPGEPDGRKLLIDLPEKGTIGLGVADRVARVYINDRLVSRVEHADEENIESPRTSVQIGLRSAAATFSAPRIDHDLQYQTEGQSSWDIPEDCFVMLGDNTAQSKDSRKWVVRKITTADGTTYRGERTVTLEDRSSVPFVTSEDGSHYEFLDIDGVPRRIPVEGTTKPINERVPFVRREDLIGRAFLIFWPVRRKGDFRPHFLP